MLSNATESATTPVKLLPSPTKEPVNEPVKGEVKSLNCNEDEIRVGLPVMLSNATESATTPVKPEPSPKKEPVNWFSLMLPKESAISVVVIPPGFTFRLFPDISIVESST